ncbi:pyridoxamine 5'-phosphate oxidase family protein [Streptosporangium sp. NPDC006013]|uniref:pyridoxamine 5'-phosphate oxidase family protein n=1 Tax=Streptosporangium sp. NPDC006013 TaxID=3155596 RepID=UPI0033BEBBB3
MSDCDPVAEIGPFSDSGADVIPWPIALRELEQARLFWLSTVRPDGRPHVTPLLAVWTGGALYFATGDQERKTRNLHANDHCVMTTGTNVLDGIDITIEGRAELVCDPAERSTTADAYECKYGDLLTSPDGTWHGLGDTIRSGNVLLYRIDPEVGFAFGKGETYSQIRYRFQR